MIKQLSPEKALVRLEELCARAEHSTGELRRKLYGWRISGSDAEEIIESLRRRRFVDDARFASAYVRDKYRFNHWGRMKIRMELRARGVDNDDIEQALEQIDEEIYMEALRSFIENRIRTVRGEDGYERRQKLFRAAAGRGYESNLIVKVLKTCDFGEN